MDGKYTQPQRAVDSMVYYCDGIFISNYVTVTDYLSPCGFGKWDNRMKFRVDQGNTYFGGITIAAKKFNKLDYPIIEIQSLEPNFLLNMYVVTAKTVSFWNLVWRSQSDLQ
ncbi:MAG: hypothetical protein IPH33_19455 [Bacteroidetes bacterium]|nr:hypothetical protein [Bacteroidota bacterium]